MKICISAMYSNAKTAFASVCRALARCPVTVLEITESILSYFRVNYLIFSLRFKINVTKIRRSLFLHKINIDTSWFLK